MNKFLTLSYYFGIRPDSDFKFTTLTFLFGLLLLVLSIAIRFYRKRYVKDEVAKRILKRYPPALAYFSLVLFFLLLFREAGIPFLSMRIWSIAYLIILLGWIVKAPLGYKKEYHHRSRQVNKTDPLNKYLPRKKR